MADVSRAFRGMAIAATTCIALAAGPAAAFDAPVRLEPFNVDPSQVSVSGHSSGGAMAIQLGVAYSSRIMGVGAFAGLAYDCGRPGNVTYHTCLDLNTADISELQAHMNLWSGHEIDPVANIARQKIYIFAGVNDFIYNPTIVHRTTVKLYEQFAPAGNIRFESTITAGHVFPTDFDNPYSVGTTCSDTGLRSPPANCHFDGAGATLQWIYGLLNPRNDGVPTGSLLAVDQREFVASEKGMDDVAWLYVPNSCANGMVCRLHVFLHGCGASYFKIGDPFLAKYSGHSRWADTNGIVLLFPQTLPDPELNPDGCWDYEGRYDIAYDQKAGTQTTAIMAMVARIVSGYQATATARAIEFRHAEWDHYFVTMNADEIVKLDTGVSAGWARTNESFGVYPLATPGTSNVCRFFSTSFDPKSSHFYAPSAAECATVMQNPDWKLEGLVFAVVLPDGAGDCAAGTQPLYRLFNDGQGGAPNHRYTTSLAIRASMMNAGWVPEGEGVGVVGCATQ